MKNRFLIVFQDNDNKIYYLKNLGGVSEIIDNKILFSTLDKYAMWYNTYQTAKAIETKMWNRKLPKTNLFDIVSSDCIRYDYIIGQKYIYVPNNSFNYHTLINVEF